MRTVLILGPLQYNMAQRNKKLFRQVRTHSLRVTSTYAWNICGSTLATWVSACPDT